MTSTANAPDSCLADGIERSSGQHTRKRLTAIASWFTVLGAIVFALGLLASFIGHGFIARQAKSFITGKLVGWSDERGDRLAEVIFAPHPEADSTGASSELEEAGPESKDDAAVPTRAERLLRRLSDGKDKVLQSKLIQDTKTKLHGAATRFIDERKAQIHTQLVNRFAAGQGANGTITMEAVLHQLIDEMPGESTKTELKRLVSTAIESRSAAVGNWVGVVKQDYDQLAAKLVEEIRIFCFLHFLVLGLMAALLLGLRENAPYIILPATLMLLATVVELACYFLLQDWSNAILYGKYWSWYTGVVLGGVAIFLFDIIYLNAQITAQIILSTVQAVEGFLRGIEETFASILG